MKCPKCKKKAKASATRFIEYSHTQRRIRTCECGFKFVTHEIIEPDKQDLGKTSKEKKKDFWCDEWYQESSSTYIWDREFLKDILNRNKEVDVK